ncbi:MAG: ABC transporter ATP-binding protein [Campylobacter sp.]|uniref:ABC transporter ATP-binding protein n=1 Tax=Campylobacter sp. TaxID=205 RepID=UPI002A93CBB5|nr:ABC transporter ATP-binding protein [Campylobacter sp.]MCI7587418.1 ABC transporter ATP-binding protein [Campylobacter sp.]MDY5385033.1 ABC transporter ATP-binding protein [Campylobacter sp.]
MLQAINLSHSFEYSLFSEVNLDIKAGSTTAIVGASGSGKSTILHILSTLLKPKSGEVIFGGKNLYSLKDDELLKIRRQDFGIIFQAHYLFRGFSAGENIELASILSGQKIDKNILERLGIAGLMSQKASELSGGQQQRISIARVLAKRPKIIFADEPTGNLDSHTAADVMSVLCEYAKEQSSALVLVTHDERLAGQMDAQFRLENEKLNQIRG